MTHNHEHECCHHNDNHKEECCHHHGEEHTPHKHECCHHHEEAHHHSNKNEKQHQHCHCHHGQIEQAIQLLKQAGFKYTSKREKIIEIFSHEDRYLSAKQVQQLLETDFPNMSYDTIYRNLYDFTDLGILETTEWNGEKLFRFGCSNEGHHHHFICEKCGRTKEIEFCPMTYFETQLEGCEVHSHRFEVFGLCEKCANIAS